MGPTTRLFPLLALITLIPACAQIEEHTDLGVACLVPSAEFPEGERPSVQQVPPEVTYEDGEFYVEVLFSECIGCGDILEETCTAELQGDTIVVSSTFAMDVRPRRVCNLICTAATTTCSIPDLEPGTYTLVYGDFEGQVEVPSTSELLCVGERG